MRRPSATSSDRRHRAYVLDAYIEAAGRRYAGELFYGMLLLEENHDRVLTAFAPAVWHKRRTMTAAAGC